MSGKFITFEGPDGSGKTTLVNGFKNYLDSQKIEYLATKEPGSPLDPVCSSLRKFILSPENDIQDEAEIFLYLADRCQHVNKIIWPALKSGKLVLCDRYIDSTYAYQGFGRRFGNEMWLKRIEYLNDITTDCLVPDLTFLLMVDPEVGLRRCTKTEFGQPDRLESQKLDFHKRLCSGYEDIIKKFPARKIIKIDTTEMLAEDVLNKTINVFKTFLEE